MQENNRVTYLTVLVIEPRLLDKSSVFLTVNAVRLPLNVHYLSLHAGLSLVVTCLLTTGRYVTNTILRTDTVLWIIEVKVVPFATFVWYVAIFLAVLFSSPEPKAHR